MSTLTRLQDWYAHQCDDEWEHSSGVIIESTDNPGWWIKVNLVGTPLQTRYFAEVAENIDAQRFALSSSWLSCRVENGIWHGAGDETKLERILDLFLLWAEANAT